MADESKDRDVFFPAFLQTMEGKEGRWRTDAEAALAGPFRVMKRGEEGFAVLSAAVGDDGDAVAVFREEQWALLAAATLGSEPRDLTLRLSPERHEGGGVSLVEGRLDDACEVRTAGWLAHGHPETLEAIHVAEYVLRSPHRLAALLEAAGEQVLKDASAILARRLAGE